jgi:hypothetical protein
MMMRSFAAIRVFSLTLGCVPFSDNSLSLPSDGKWDSRLHGTWHWRNANETIYMHFGLDEKSSLIRVMIIEFDKDGDLNHSVYFLPVRGIVGNAGDTREPVNGIGAASAARKSADVLTTNIPSGYFPDNGSVGG